MDLCFSQAYYIEVKRKEPHPDFELWPPIPYFMPITIAVSVPFIRYAYYLLYYMHIRYYIIWILHIICLPYRLIK